MQARPREQFLLGLWSYWLQVGIALRRVRKSVEHEKTTAVLMQLWKERARIPERAFGDAPAGFWSERNVLWLRRSELRVLLRLPTTQFSDDDAANVFYRGQAFYDRTTAGATHKTVREWRIATELPITVQLPPALHDFVRSELELDLDRLAFPGVYFNGYDDATIWIGCTFDEGTARDLPSLSPVERVRILQDSVVTRSPERALLEPVLRATLHLALTPVPHRELFALITHAVENDLMPPSLVPDALRYLLFVQTEAITANAGLILGLVNDRWSVVRDVFTDQAHRDIGLARKALVLLIGGLGSHWEYHERILRDVPQLLDPETLLGVLQHVRTKPRGTSLFDRFADFLRRAPGVTKSQLRQLKYVSALRHLGENPVLDDAAGE